MHVFRKTKTVSAGHAVVLSYYEAICSAIRDKDFSKLRKLHEAGLSVPIRIRSDPSCAEVIMDALSWSEEHRVNNLACRESVMDFVEKLGFLPPLVKPLARAGCGAELENEMVKLGIRFGGKRICRTTAKAIICIHPFTQVAVLRDAFRELRNATDAVDEMTKLMRIFQTAEKRFGHGAENVGTQNAICFLLESLRVALYQKELHPNELTRVFLVGETTKTAAYTHVCFKKAQFIEHIGAWVRANQETTERGALCAEIREKVFPHLRNPVAMVLEFSAEAVDGVDSSTTRKVSEVTQEKYVKYRKSLTPAAALLADTLRGTLTDSFNDEFLQLAQLDLGEGPTSDWTEYLSPHQQTEESKTSGLKPNLRVAYGEFMKACHWKPQASSAIGDLSAAPMEHVAEIGDEDAKREREALWKRICEKRKEVIKIHCPQTQLGSVAHALKTIFKDTAFALAGASGSDKKTSRMFLLNADVFAPPAPKPQSACCLGYKDLIRPSDDFTSALDFIAQHRQNTDYIVVFDGRSRAVQDEVRAWMEKHGGDSNRYVDAWVIYGQPLATDPRFPKRKVAFSCNNREVMHIHLPQLKTRMKITGRDSFKLVGESSTHHTTYTGVPIRTLAELPRFGLDAKNEITGQKGTPTLDNEISSEVAKNGAPLFWSDWKPIAFWSTVYRDLGVTHVFDCASVGAGSAAIGALYAGVRYDGVCVNAAHREWLERLMNRATACVMSEGAASYDAKTVGKDIQRHFADIVAETRRYLRPAAESMEEEDVREGIVTDGESESEE